MPSPNYPVLCCPLPYRVAPVFVQVVSPPLGWSPLSSVLVMWSPSHDTRGPSVVFEAVDMPCAGLFNFYHRVHCIYIQYMTSVLSLTHNYVGPSIFVCDVEHTYFHFGLCGRKFVMCLFGQCQGFCTICHSWQHTGVVHLSIQADGKVVLKISRCLAYGVCNYNHHHNYHHRFPSGMPNSAGRAALLWPYTVLDAQKVNYTLI